MKKSKNTFKKDSFKTTRGGYSRLLNIFCRACTSLVLTYQKDGPGNLRRLYFDRIFSPDSLNNLKHTPLKEVKDLRCPSCKEYLGTPYIYKREKRKAFRLYQDAITKKVRKLND